MINQIIHGDCFEVLKTIPDNYFDSLITDPPAGISFMGKNWDDHKGGMLNWINWFSEVMNECLRTMKPGACGLVWSIPRTSHWTGMALELAGFRLIDIVHACNGSGFPKGQDIGKNLPEYDGWKTPALKPAVEGWWLVQKPISESSIAKNILKHGVGGLNIEATRIEGEGWSRREGTAPKFSGKYNNGVDYQGYEPGNIRSQQGRYPANLILSCSADCDGDNHSPDCPVSVIGEQSGICTSGDSAGNRRFETTMFQGLGKKTFGDDIPKSTGTAARYFKQLPFDPETVSSVYYQAKASTKDRSCGGTVENIHPTVKSRHLMKYLIQLITPPNGMVLDPFAGSGTTAIACKELGRNYICIEKELDYYQIACQRINQPVGLGTDEIIEPQPTEEPRITQLSLF